MGISLLALVLALVGSLVPAVSGPPAAGAAATVRISGTVTDGGIPIDGVDVDLFISDPEGNRVAWVTSTVTGGEGDGPGRYHFDVVPGCFAVTFIAPAGRTFVGGNRYLNLAGCINSDAAGADASLRPAPEAAATGTVLRERRGDPAGGIESGLDPAVSVPVDLFAAGPDGERAAWLESTVTEADGSFRFDVPAGCYVITFVGGIYRFARTGGPYQNLPFCVAAGETLTGLDARQWFEVPLVGARAHTVRLGLSHLSGVGAHLFTADADGNRLRYWSSTTSDINGEMYLAADPGCWVIVFGAPTNWTWADTGGPWLEKAFCLEANQLIDLGELAAVPPPETRIAVRVDVRRDGRIVGDVGVELFTADAAGTPGPLVKQFTTTERFETTVIVDPGRGCWLVVFTAPDGLVFEETGTGRLTRPFCTSPEQGVYEFNEVLATLPSPSVDLDLAAGPHDLTGTVTAAAGVDYRLTGRPGDQVSVDLVDINDGGCSRFPWFDLTVTTSAGTVLNAVSTGERGCTAFGPYTVPDDGVLVVRARSDGASYRMRIGTVSSDRVAVDASSGQARLTGAFPVAFSSVDYVITAPAGRQISFDATAPGCVTNIALGFELLNPAGQVEDGFGSDCQAYGPWTVPADGTVTLRIRHLFGSLAAERAPATYDLRVSVFERSRVTVPVDGGTAELVGSIDVPRGGTDHELAVDGYDLITIEPLAPDGGPCTTTTGPALRLEVVVDGVAYEQEVTCDPRGPFGFPPGTTSLTVRVTGSRDFSDPTRPYTGPYRFRVTLATTEVTTDG